MKPLINKAMSAAWSFKGDEETVTHYEYAKRISDQLQRFCVHHKLDTTTELSSVTVLVQKVTLSEISMNTLFFECLCEFVFDLRYAGIGGEGCDFSLEIA